MPSEIWPSIRGIASRSRRSVLRGIAWLAGILAATAVLGFLVLPLVARSALERNLSSALDRKVTIARLQVNPFALSTTLHDVSVADRADGPPLLTIEALYVNAEVSSLWRWAPVVSGLKATRPVVRLVRNADKTYNISDLLERALSGPAGPAPRFSVSNIEVVDGTIRFDDRPEHREHAITEINLGIPFVSSLPAQTEIEVEPRFSAYVNGQPVAVTGESRPFKDTHETALHWDLGDLSLPAYIDYVPVALPVKVRSGVVSASANLSFIGEGKDPPQLTLDGTFRLVDFGVSEPSGTSLLRVPSLTLVVDRFDILGHRADIRSIDAEGVELDVRRSANGELNLAALLRSEGKAASAPYRFRAGRIDLRKGTVHLTDAAVAPVFASTLSDVSVNVVNLSSRGDRAADVALSFVSDTGARIAHSGTLGFDPLRVDGRLELSGLHLARLFPYYASALNLVVDDGTLDGATRLRLAEGALTLTELDATANNLRLRLPDQKQPLWQAPALAVRGGAVDVSKRAVTFASIEGRGAAATIQRDAGGTLNFARLLRTPEHGAAPTAADAAWSVQTDRLAFEDFVATFVDESVTPPARVALSRVAVVIENPSGTGKGRAKATLRATVNKRGTLSLAGPITLAPAAATLDVAAVGVDLAPFQGYLAQSARVILTGGTASARGTIDFAAGAQARAGFKGDLVLSDVVILDEANGADLLKWKTLKLADVDARQEPLAVAVGDIALDDFFARLLLDENGEFNLQQLDRHRAPVTEAPKPAPDAKSTELATPVGTATPWLRLGKATLRNGDVDFTDHYIRPNYSASLTGLTGSVSSLGFDQPANVELHGSLRGGAPVEIAGRINPLGENLFLDMKAEASDIDLPPLSPYSGKYVGYQIEKGKLTMKVSYLIENRNLRAENSIVLNQLTFGEKVDSPDAIKAPVELAVTLLKDRNGVIRFDLPISGSLDDPHFSVGRLVLRAILNLIVKIVTAPFALLGSLGGHDADLAYIEFAPGSAALDKAGDEKVKAIAKALNDRPAVKLDLYGRVDPAVDREALKHAAIDRQIRARKFNDLVRAGDPPASADAVEVADGEYEALLTRVYKEAKFDKPRNAIGFQKDLPRNEMEALLLANATVSDEDLRALADRRAEVVRTSIVEREQVSAERVFLLAPRLSAEGVKDSGKPTRVDFAVH